MIVQPIGFQWIKEHFCLDRYQLTHASFIGSHEHLEVTINGNIEQTYGIKYGLSENSVLKHVEFGLKHDDINLDFLNAVFQKIPDIDVIEFIKNSPTGKYSRKIGFLYEFLTQKILSITPQRVNYVDLLDSSRYVCGIPIKNIRWSINNNLLGVPDYCPIVRKTKALSSLMHISITEKIAALNTNFSHDILSRANNFLYRKETRSSYEIEHEKPTTDRIEQFVALLSRAGEEKTGELLKERLLTNLQNAIVDNRFAAIGFRDFQNYIGENLPGGIPYVHYICPPPDMIPTLMNGLNQIEYRTAGISANVRAAILAFGFVFIHPFEDGNGRIHRFLIHDILVHDEIIAHGQIIPISAHMLAHKRQYDRILEKYSAPLMQRIKYDIEEQGKITITNAQEVEGYFRYPDLTDQCVYLCQALLDTVSEDMYNELMFLQQYDYVKKAIQSIVDMPDRMINDMILFLHQNNGILSKNKRSHFSKLTDEEVEKMQQAYQNVFKN
ncbi:Fic family protein [Chitinophaga sp. Cy-1792]|uniref:Fic family protein n=1 Tax=Chitinophaga sp. Cy-1792 TaxID=2608339 RepID=UPI001421AD04|nr:Fic family protein [Chitinophaga sp. Cy-1792]NIG57260.1 Fic family protein [Chitinophaga sp. Cy-1792]